MLYIYMYMLYTVYALSKQFVTKALPSDQPN